MKTLKFIGMLTLVCFSLLILSNIVVAEGKVEIKGTIQSVDLQNKTAVIKTADKTLITVIIENKDVLKRLEKGCISEGDFVYVKYVVKDGKNVSTYFWPLGPVE